MFAVAIHMNLNWILSAIFTKMTSAKEQLQAQLSLLKSVVNMFDDMELNILNLVQLLLKMLDISAIPT